MAKSSNIPQMKPSQLAESLTTVIKLKRAALVWGKSGIGKSEIIRQVAANLKLRVEDVRAVLLDPVDLRGLPHVNEDNRAHWAIPEFLPDKGEGVLFLDELNRAPTLVQNACLGLILERKLGNYRLPDGWAVIGACNESGAIGTVKTSEALNNRFCHFEAVADPEEWCRWATQNNIEPSIMGFIRFQPQLLVNEDKNEKAWPSPRSWSYVSKFIQEKCSPTVERSLIASAVGEGAAVEFAAFLKSYRDLPDIDEIIKHPKTAKMPKKNEPAEKYAIAAALGRKMDAKNIGNCLTYLNRLDDQEFAVLAVRDGVFRDNSIASTDEGIKWFEDNNSLLCDKSE